MTSNLASEEIAEHALQLRQEAEAVTERRYGDDGDNKDIEVTETLTISRRSLSLPGP